MDPACSTVVHTQSLVKCFVPTPVFVQRLVIKSVVIVTSCYTACRAVVPGSVRKANSGILAEKRFSSAVEDKAHIFEDNAIRRG